MKQLPSNLFKFYFKHAFQGFYKYILLFLVVTFLRWSGAVIWPFIERMIVAMFENAVIGTSVVTQVLPNILMIVILNLGLSCTDVMYDHLSSVLMPALKRRISEKMTDYVHTQSMSFWANRMSGSIHTNISYCVNGAKTVVTDVWLIFVRVALILINATLLFTVNEYIAIIFIAMFILRVIFMWVFRNPIKKSSEKSAAKNSELNGKILDGFANQAIVKLFSSVKQEHDYLEKTRQEDFDLSRFAAFIRRLSWGIPTFFWDFCLGAMLVFCAILYGRGMMQISDVVYSMSVYFNVMGSISGLIDSIPTIMDSLSSANKGYRELVVPIEVTDKEDASELVVRHGKIEFKNVSFKYKNRYVLRDLSLTIKPGECIGIVGPSGAGKTTLVNLLMRFYDVGRGAILIDGQDIRDVTQSSLRENISFIPQDPAMFNRTIRENIAYGRPDVGDAEIKRAAKNASADKFIMAIDKKYNALVGDRGIKLSGGQRQRIAIARAFLKDAPILVLDEATSALDSETEVAIQKSFEKLSHNRTTIAIAHRLSTLRNMDRIVVLDRGRVVESGTHKSLLRRGGEYARLWKMQSGGFLQEDKPE